MVNIKSPKQNLQLEPIRKIILGENVEALGERGEGSKIAASVAVATLRTILGSSTKLSEMHRNLQSKGFFG